MMKATCIVFLASGVLALGATGIGCEKGPNTAHAGQGGFHSHATLPAPAAPAESPEDAVMAVTNGIADGRIYVIWDALPASYQRDLEEIVHEFARAMDADIWNQSFALLSKTANVLENQRDNILAMPNVQQDPDFDVEMARQNWHHVLAPFRTIASCELSDVNELSRIDLRQFMGTTGAQLFAQIERLSEISGDDASSKIASLRNIRATLVSREGERAMVQIDVPGEQPKTEAFVRVEGKWIPEDMARDWKDEMAEARRELANMSNQKMQEAKPQVMALLGSLDGFLDQLDMAQSPEQFEQMAQMGMFQVFGAMMAMGQAMQDE